MKPENLYHTGLVVDDVESAKRWYEKIAGHKWTSTGGGEQTVKLAGGEETIRMVMAYSIHTPRIELVQSVPGTIWTPADSGVHHLGYWSEDVDRDLDELLKNGAEFEARSTGPNGAALWAYCKHPAFGRIELVGTVMKPRLERWFGGT